MRGVFAAGAAVLGQLQFFGRFGLVAFRKVVEIAADGAFHA